MTEFEFAKKIQEFAPQISSQPLCFARHEPEAGARPSCCFYNVLDKVRKDGGSMVIRDLPYIMPLVVDITSKIIRMIGERTRNP